MGEALRDALLAAGLVAASAAAIASVRGELFDVHKRIKDTTDAYVLPPPSSVVALSMGYRSALADYLWAGTLVESGLKLQERRRFQHLLLYIETINELDPTFREPYLMADALVTLQTGGEPPVEEIRRTRRILERGAKERPLDGEIWLTLGQFVTFLSPSYLKDEAEIQRWREEGTPYLAKAAELSGDNASIAWQALGGASILRRKGERDAAIRFLRRTLAVTEDEELRKDVELRLERLLGEEELEKQRARQRDFEAIWRDKLPFVSKSTILVLGPQPDPFACAGVTWKTDPACARTWREWAEIRERSAADP